MASMATNKEDRIKEMNDYHNQVESIFECEQDVFQEFIPEETRKKVHDSWCKLSKAERDLMRDIDNG